MNNNVCYYLFNDFTITWDPETLTKDFPVVAAGVHPFKDPTGNAHWQLFATDVMFARNFAENFRDQCVEVADKIKKIQADLVVNDDSLEILKEFKKHKVIPQRVNLIKTLPGKDIKLHVDSTRTICLNIGLKNSNKWVTHIFNDHMDSQSISKFDIKDLDKYDSERLVLNDGDGYLLKIDNPHTAICLNKEDTYTTRYILTYSL